MRSPGHSLGIRMDQAHRRSAPIRSIRPAARTNSTSSTNELDDSTSRRTEPICASANELGPWHERNDRHKRTWHSVQTNSMDGTNELGPWRERTRPVGADELSSWHERTRPVARTNSTRGATNSVLARTKRSAQKDMAAGTNELGPWRERTRPVARTNSLGPWGGQCDKWLVSARGRDRDRLVRCRRTTRR